MFKGLMSVIQRNTGVTDLQERGLALAEGITARPLGERIITLYLGR